MSAPFWKLLQQHPWVHDHILLCTKIASPCEHLHMWNLTYLCSFCYCNSQVCTHISLNISQIYIFVYTHTHWVCVWRWRTSAIKATSWYTIMTSAPTQRSITFRGTSHDLYFVLSTIFLKLLYQMPSYSYYRNNGKEQ